MFNFNANTTISTTTTTSTSTSTTTTITNTMNNNNMNRRTRQRVEWSEEEIRLLINQRRHRNLEYYRTPGRSRTAFWNSVARRINRFAGRAPHGYGSIQVTRQVDPKYSGQVIKFMIQY